MEIHVTRSVELVVCLAAIDTMVTVCVDLGGGETDVTVTATMFNNLLILIKSTLQLLKIFANSKLKWMNWSHYRKWFLVRLINTSAGRKLKCFINSLSVYIALPVWSKFYFIYKILYEATSSKTDRNNKDKN